MPDDSQKKKIFKYRMLLCICVLIYVLALLVRMVKITLDPTLTRDGSLYLIWVEHWIATGDFFYTFFNKVGLVPPFALWTIKILTLSGLDPETAGRSVSMFFGSLIPVVAFLFAFRGCRNIRIAMVAALVLVFHPDLVLYSGQPLRENGYIFFSGMLFLFVMEAVRKSTAAKWAVCGIFLALSAHCRFEALEFAAIVPLVLAALCYFKKMIIKDAIRNAAFFFLVFGLTSVLLLACADFDPRIIIRPLEHIAQSF